MIDLNKISQKGKNAILIRHSERYKLPEDGFGTEINLTPKGFEMAEKLGKNLQHFKINKIFTSPVKRCIQTAKGIKKGFNKNIVITEHKMLGLPSIFVNDIHKAGETFKSMSEYDFYRTYISNKNLSGWNLFSEACKQLDNFIKLSILEGLTIFISHDIMVMFFIYFKTGKIFSQDEWLGFLEGLNLTYND